MAYNLLLNAIKKGKMSKAELIKRADVFYMVEELTTEEYTEIMKLIKAM